MINDFVYPCVFEKLKEGGYTVFVPDFNSMTQGEDLNDAISMARDLIQLHILTCEEDGFELVMPNTVKIGKLTKNAFVSYVDVNMVEYREKYGRKKVKKNCTIPQYLATKAEMMKINFSQTLTEALEQKLAAVGN